MMRSFWKPLVLICCAGVLLLGCVLLTQPLVDPSAAPISPSSPELFSTVTETAPAAGCAYVWSNRSLPEITLQLNQAFQASGMSEVQAEASAYGEDCFDSTTNQTVQFIAMQTDFYINVAAGRLDEPQELGVWVEKIMRVLEDFPPGQVPGPNPGYVGISFTAGSETTRLWFRRTDAARLIQEGVRGGALYDALREP